MRQEKNMSYESPPEPVISKQEETITLTVKLDAIPTNGIISFTLPIGYNSNYLTFQNTFTEYSQREFLFL